MVIAMIAMGMMKMIADEIVDMVAMRHGLVPAAWPVHVGRLMAATLVTRRTPVRIGRADLDLVLVDMIAMHVMQVAVMQVVDMALVQYRRMAALRPMLMSVIGRMRQCALGHGKLQILAVTNGNACVPWDGALLSMLEIAWVVRKKSVTWQGPGHGVAPGGEALTALGSVPGAHRAWRIRRRPSWSPRVPRATPR